MRLPALLCVIGFTSVVVPTADAQASLPTRVFDLSQPLGAPQTVPPAAEWWQDGGPRIRPIDKRVKALLGSGLERSALLRELVAQIESSDVIVYVGMSPVVRRGMAGALTFVSDAGPFRYLRATLSPELTNDQAISALAHELHHVTEIMAHPEVRSESTLAALYRRIGRENRRAIGSGWETAAAQQAGWAVRRELNDHAADTVARREAGEPGQSQ